MTKLMRERKEGGKNIDNIRKLNLEIPQKKKDWKENEIEKETRVIKNNKINPKKQKKIIQASLFWGKQIYEGLAWLWPRPNAMIEGANWPTPETYEGRWK